MGDMEASVPLLGRPEGIGQGGESGLVAAIFNLSNTSKFSSLLSFCVETACIHLPIAFREKGIIRLDFTSCGLTILC